MSNEVPRAEFMQELNNLRILTSLQKNALEELENKLVEQAVKNGELEAQMIALQEMRKPSLKEILMLANNAGLYVKIQLGCLMGTPSLLIEVEKGYRETLYADRDPVATLGDFKHQKTYIPLLAIPEYPDAIVDLLLENTLIRELVEAPNEC